MTVKQEHRQFIGAVFVTTLASQASSIVDAAIGGHLLGANVVSVLNLVLPVEEVFYALTLLLGMGACTAAAKAYGEGLIEHVRMHFTSAIVTALCVFGMLATLLFLASDSVVDVLCGDSYLRGDTERYLMSVLPWFVVGNLVTIMSEFVAMTGRPLLMTYCALAYFVTKTGFNLLFVGALGFGIEGLGYSSLVSSLVTIIILLPYCVRRESPLRFVRSSFRQMSGAVNENIHYGKGLMAVEVSYILFSFAMNALVLRYMGEKGLFCWSVVMMIYLVGDYAAAAAQETILSLGGKHQGAGLRRDVSTVFRRSMWFATVWILLCLAMVYVLPDVMLPLLGATDPTHHTMLMKVIAMTVAVPVGLNLANLYLVLMVIEERVKMFMVLISVLYLSVPLFLFLTHCIVPGKEWWGMLALLPLQVGISIFSCFACRSDK